MRFVIPIVVFVALCLGSAQADAASSCSAFAVIKAYDADAKTVELSFGKGKERKYFPKPEGTPKTSKIQDKCKRKVTRNSSFLVKPTGGKLSVTQVRSNFEARVVNDLDDPAWLPAQLKQLIEAKTQVVVVIRAGIGKDAPLGVTTIYLPITEEEKAEIKRIDDQAEDI
jgi:hypothetical protein